MRKVIALFTFLAVSYAGYSQTTIPSGIVSFTSSTQPPIIWGNTQNNWTPFIISAGNGSPQSGCYIHMFSTNMSNYADPSNGHIDLVSVGTPAGNDGIVFTNYDPTASSNQYKRLLVARKDGKVLIGDDLWLNNLYPGDYKLYVASGILTEKVKVALSTTSDWADYVFHKKYTLMPLTQLSAYIQQNRHLPGIPTTAEVMKTGVDLGAMTAKLLEKVEELTLYVIELNKEKQALQEKVAALQTTEKTKQSSSTVEDLEKKLAELKAEVDALKK